MTDPSPDFSEIVSQRFALIALVQDISVTFQRQIVQADTLDALAELGKRVEGMTELLTPRYPPGTAGA